MTTAIDRELVTRAVGRDPDATGALLAQLRPGLVRYCRARLGHIGGAYTTADDVAQEICIALLGALPRYRDAGRPFAAFVYGIAAHKVADAQRAAGRSATAAPVESLAVEPDPTPGPEQQAVRTDLGRRLTALLARLPEVHREIVLLRVAAGLSAEEVGAVVGMSPAAVRVTQSRALAKLRTLAGESLGEAA
jgi:RNA polymerase sigma-70 factor (ECF subfamily)